MKISHWDSNTSCWTWPGWKNECGYGVLDRNKHQKFAHRMAYEAWVGIIPPGLCVLHKCDNPPCVNPAHLFLGTRSDNNKDRARKGRNGKHRTLKLKCKHGHTFKEANTQYRLLKNGTVGRYCGTCSRDRAYQWYRDRRLHE